jgi:hypothetical protein
MLRTIQSAPAIRAARVVPQGNFAVWASGVAGVKLCAQISRFLIGGFLRGTPNSGADE